MLCSDLILDHWGCALLCRCRWRSVLDQGHRVRGVAQRRCLNLEHQLIDCKASLSSNFVSGLWHVNHLQRKHIIECYLCLYWTCCWMIQKKQCCDKVSQTSFSEMRSIYILCLTTAQLVWDRLILAAGTHTDLAVHRFATSIWHAVRCSIDRQPDGPRDGPSERVVHIDWELNDRQKDKREKGSVSIQSYL